MSKAKYEIYADNAGSVYMCILDGNGECVRIFEGFEQGRPGLLRDAIKDLDDDAKAYELWDGDLVERLHAEGVETTAEDLYNEGLGDLIATDAGQRGEITSSGALYALGIGAVEVTFAATTDDHGRVGDYMAASCNDRDGELIRLCATEYMEDHGFGNDDSMEDFDSIAYPLLKDAIIQQAKASGVDPACLRFFWG